ncbi:hypothetical protein [Methanoplanus endosymbiosus]|uniref:Uncharacterized protein n=1 Tax=Methanoplanus endosymbiosus TaxID=33865 RepID=A0A9E7PR19_9EURY|nr:hypothetical protein [Methanoplanus endosymbiosus]UUX93306.1 hypothetical protein L6E24_04050 [Methanoplanus endosymbiosus]
MEINSDNRRIVVITGLGAAALIFSVIAVLFTGVGLDAIPVIFVVIMAIVAIIVLRTLVSRKVIYVLIILGLAVRLFLYLQGFSPQMQI